MSFEQRVGTGWRCDGCGKVAKWDDQWRTYGSMAEVDEGILCWVACSDACAKKMPPELKKLPPPNLAHSDARASHRERVAAIRARYTAPPPCPPDDDEPCPVCEPKDGGRIVAPPPKSPKQVRDPEAPLARFERLAAEFRAETGVEAPRAGDEPERWQRWTSWLRARNAAAPRQPTPPRGQIGLFSEGDEE